MLLKVTVGVAPTEDVCAMRAIPEQLLVGNWKCIQLHRLATRSRAVTTTLADQILINTYGK